MTCSWYYHNYKDRSSESMFWLRKFDLAGICVCIMGGATPPFYYGYMCEEDRFLGRIFLGQVWFFCLIALFVTMMGSGDDNGFFTRHRKCIAAFAYIIAGWSSAPGGFYMLYHKQNLPSFDVWAFLLGGILYA